MNLWTFLAIIIVVTILADMYSKNQKNKLRFKGTDKKYSELQETVKKLEKRIENLEIIAVSDPDNFQDRTDRGFHEPRTHADPPKENQRLVNELAQKRSHS